MSSELLSSWRIFPSLLRWSVPAVAAVLALSFASGADIQSLRGRLEAVQAPLQDKPLVLTASGGKKVTVFGDEFSEGQLRDPRLAGREWEFEGKFTPDGRFEIYKLFTIKNGKRYRVTYFCEVCNIRTYEPGRCMCCQDETELQEIPEP